MNETLLYFSIIYNGQVDKIFYALKRKEKVDETKLNLFLKEIKDKKIKYLTILEPDYPAGLLKYKYPPYVIFYKGNLDILKQKSFMIIADEDKEKPFLNFLTDKFLKNSSLIVSDFNLNKGILNLYKSKNSNIIYILAEGIEKAPKTILKNELYISQYPFNTQR